MNAFEILYFTINWTIVTNYTVIWNKDSNISTFYVFNGDIIMKVINLNENEAKTFTENTPHLHRNVEYTVSPDGNTVMANYKLVQGRHNSPFNRR